MRRFRSARIIFHKTSSARIYRGASQLSPGTKIIKNDSVVFSGDLAKDHSSKIFNIMDLLSKMVGIY